MHLLPAHQGEEVAAGFVDSPCSVVFDQTENRLHLQRAFAGRDVWQGWTHPLASDIFCLYQSLFR